MGAKTALDGAVQCPVANYPAYLAHILRADLAVREGDWATAAASLVKVEIHPEAKLSARAGFLRLRADLGLNDKVAFARDRAALVQANENELAQAGRRIETFHAGSAAVSSFEAAIDQGQFHRTVEFIIVPDDPVAYPASMQLTDDRQAVQVSAGLAKPGAAKPAHVWFVDLYTCLRHSTLAPPIIGDAAPTYPELKAQLIARLADGTVTSAVPSATNAICASTPWILPGLGRVRASRPPEAPVMDTAPVHP
ncbi:hypothetical protein KZX46_05975 [Polymorphobacter sp. PAMC 29334]|uniref:hypothetical protein n=1 Tax=Polymorphobacter sp. PAMC 29334 TaxID=2862331 RepID=UPI001C76D839|nr:hypothetical protein [Polymorphobacter sp. PAMC 29334]QYE35521.1 hypothetical protein KZX46_05975 [Polymorphobacter sp. PAMC 29334]